MSDIAGEPVENEAPEFDPPAPPEPAAQADAPSLDPEAWAAFAKSQGFEKFANDPTGVFKSYGELEKQFHSRQPEPQYEPEPDPRSYLPPYVDEQLWTQVSNYAATNPAEAAQWAMAHPDQLGHQLTQALEQNWAANDPAGYHRYLVQSSIQQYVQPYVEQFQPANTYVQEQQVSHAVTASAQSLPEFDRYKDAIAQRIDQNQHYYGPMLDRNPAAMAEVVKQVYAQIRGEEWLANLSAQAPQDAQVDSKKTNARTLTRSTAASQGDESDEDKFAALIANARGV